MLFRGIAFSFLAFFVYAGGFAQADPPLDSVRQVFVNGAADAAIRSLKATTAANPSNSEQHNLLCRVFYAEERWDSAIAECERAVNLNPKNSMYQLWLGRAYGEKADHSSWFTALTLAKKTRSCFEKAVELDASNVEAHSDLSEYYIEAPGFLGGGTDKASAQADAVEKAEPATALFIRARIAEHEKQNPQAEQAYKQALLLPGGMRSIVGWT